ncbi:MAG: HD domain-containing protein [Fimbriimonadaceae bacterium]|nr:HD domain-containing protein [Fimbriimonadaceae bacterium]
MLSPEQRTLMAERLKQVVTACGDPVEQRNALTAALRGWVDAERETLRQRFGEEPAGAIFCHEQATLFDLLLARLYKVATKLVAAKLGPLPAEADLCVAAVGGYGRSALSPWSDIDLVFIPAHEENEAIDAVVREILLLLGDVLVPGRHPQVAHSYRPLSDLGLIDHQTATALLESRFVVGNESLHIHFMQNLLRSIEPVEFVHLNYEERQAVWLDARQSVFAVEPNLKSGPGGLRDFHAAIWVAKVVYGIADWDILNALRQRGVVTYGECEAVIQALEFLLLLRNWIHYRRGQKLDVLHVEYQHGLGEALRYPDGVERPAEQVMREYYKCARVIHDFSRRLLFTCRHQRLEFRHGTHVVNWMMAPNHEGIFREDPARLVLVYEERQRLRLPHAVDLERLITTNAELINRPVLNKLAVGSSLRRILTSTNDVAGTLRYMLRTGVLERLLPEFEPLMTFLPGDPAHEYTVGEHTLKVIEELQRLRDTPVGEDEQTLSDAFRMIREPEVLFLAALFHDVGKLDKTGEHSLTGAPVAAAVARRLGLPETSVERIGFLVREHLTMMRTARLRALPLPDTIEGFLKTLPQDDPLDALDMLAILTWSDARSVGDNIFRESERRMLMELFVKAAKWINERPAVDEPGARERIGRRLRDNAALRNVDPAVIQRHLGAMPTWYAVNTPPALIAKHILYLDRVDKGEDPVVEFYHALQAMHTELTVATNDRPGLLRDIAAAVTANNLDIYLAQSDVSVPPCDGCGRRSLAKIWVDDFGQPLGQVKRDRLRHDLESVLGGHETAAEVLLRRGKQVPENVVLHTVKVSNTDSRQHTVVTFRADDQRGLLYCLTNALAAEGLDIVVAKITTWRGAAEDAFYVVTQQQAKVDDDQTAELTDRLRQRLTAEPVAEGG